MEGLQLLVVSTSYKLIFSLNKILTYRIDMKAQVWENKEFENKKHKEKLLRKTLDWNKDQNNSQRVLLFLDFLNPLKQIKIKSFGTKTHLKTC